jgi:uncharacterized membrane protein YobD (UPF0266 family)
MPGQVPVIVTLTYRPEVKREPFMKTLFLSEIGLMDIEAYLLLPEEMRAKRAQPHIYSFIIRELKIVLRHHGIYPGYIDISQLQIERVEAKKTL